MDKTFPGAFELSRNDRSYPSGEILRVTATGLKDIRSPGERLSKPCCSSELPTKAKICPSLSYVTFAIFIYLIDDAASIPVRESAFRNAIMYRSS
jgi:hypothetical protein